MPPPPTSHLRSQPFDSGGCHSTLPCTSRLRFPPLASAAQHLTNGTRQSPPPPTTCLRHQRVSSAAHHSALGIHHFASAPQPFGFSIHHVLRPPTICLCCPPLDSSAHHLTPVQTICLQLTPLDSGAYHLTPAHTTRLHNVCDPSHIPAVAAKIVVSEADVVAPSFGVNLCLICRISDCDDKVNC